MEQVEIKSLWVGKKKGLVVEGNYIFFHDRGSVFLQWARLGFRVGVNYFSSAEYSSHSVVGKRARLGNFERAG